MQTPSANTISRSDRLTAVLAGNLALFQRNNALRIRDIQRFGTPGLHKAFLRIPLLLQVNHPRVPGFVDSDDAPRGIYGFTRSPLLDAVRNSIPQLGPDFAKAVQTGLPVIQSLLLMGSSGSVGHTALSDLDYWLCFCRKDLPGDQFSLLRRKADLISAWAARECGAEVHFYLVDHDELVANRLIPQGEETEGEVAPLMLKEELYRTVIHVAGRTPLWWSLPAGIDAERYEKINQLLQRRLGGRINPMDFIDLGFPDRPKPQEYLAAALWLSQKSEADPFKGALKMAVIMEQVDSGLTMPLLCDVMKQTVQTAGENDEPVDPYELMIRRVLEFAESRFPSGSLELVRTASFYKIRGVLDSRRPAVNEKKSKLLEELARCWGWDGVRTEKAECYADWPERERMELGRQMKKLLFDLYSRTAQRLLAEFPGQVTAEDKSLAPLKARILKRFSGHQHTVETLPSSLNRKTLPDVMTLAAHEGRWDLFPGKTAGGDGSSGRASGSQRIKRFNRAAHAAAWLVHNQIYSESFRIWLQPRPGPVSMESMSELLRTVSRLFPPDGSRKFEDGDSWRQGGVGARLLILNFEKSWHERSLLTMDVIYRTGWGEMRHLDVDFSLFSSETDKFISVTEKIEAIGPVKLDDIHIFTAPGAQGRKMSNNLRAVILQILSGKRRKPTGGFRGPDDTMKLDTD